MIHKSFARRTLDRVFIRNDFALDYIIELQVITLAESLGGYESLAELPYLMTHASIEEKERISLGVTENLIRVSVGLENVEDIIADLEQALKVAVGV